jgi:HD-GYP domain-containing protein (c-di-GMP phosphodiesterase class II)
MLLKIDTDKLKPGMYVVNTGLPWHSHPHVYSKVGVIESALRADNLRHEGFTEAFIDTDKGFFKFPPGKDGGPPDMHPAMDLSWLLDGEQAYPARLVALDAEMPEAKAVYRDTISYAKEFIIRAREDNVACVDQAKPLVEELLSSIIRNRDALVSLCKLQSHDEYTYAHCVNVSVLCLAFGYFLGLGHEVLSNLGLAAMCHDLGKTVVPAEVLNKPSKLTEEEFDLIRKHPGVGYDMVRKAGASSLTLKGVLDHHEKINGRGYPNGLASLRISVAGRIVGMADVYDALTSNRPYKDALSPMKALSVMFSMRGQDFHPATLERFIKCLGIYPVGSVVYLSTNEYGVVCESNPHQPLKPKVRVLMDSAMLPLSPNIVDLAAAGQGEDAVSIVKTLDSPPEGLDVRVGLGVERD